MNIYDLTDDVYDVLFKNTSHEPIDFCEKFPDAEVLREFGIINLGEYTIKIERA